MTRRTKAFLLGGSTLAVLASVLLTAAHGQETDQSVPRGTIVSASVTVPANSSATLFETPQDGRFILTQACVAGLAFFGASPLSGNTFGKIIIAQSPPCTTYVPGIALPKGEIITCEGHFFETRTCMITGVVGRLDINFEVQQ